MMGDEDKIIEDLILKGALEVSGIDLETGEPVYNFTHKLKEVHPELDKEISTFFSQEMMFLWENNFIEMDVTERNPIVRLTQKAFDTQEISKLDKGKQYTLRDLIKQISQ
jgi:hypothetical protein